MDGLKRCIALLLTILAIGTPVSAQVATKQFNTYIQSLPSASLPLAPGDQFYVLQGGVSKSVPNSAAIGSGSGGGSTVILKITRAQIPSSSIGAGTFIVNGYNNANDLGFGAVYSSVGANCTTGLMYIKDSGGTCFNLVITTTANVGWFGAKADGGATTISASDITANPQWKGTYSAGTTWDTVGTQEALYAAFAGTSTPGSIVWNSTNRGSLLAFNAALIVPAGTYGINVTLLASTTAGVIQFAGKQSALWNWTGSNPSTVWLCDHCSYTQFFNVSIQNSAAQSSGTAVPAFSVDSTSNSVFNNALLVQQNTYYDLYISVGWNGIGMEINQTSGSQGDTQTWVNPIFIGNQSDTGLIINSANALSETIIGGDFQQFLHQGVQINGGQLSTIGTHMENQNSANSASQAPLQSQFTTYGADINMTSQVNGSSQSLISGFRSEGDILAAGGFGSNTLNAGLGVYSSSVIGVDVQQWFANLSRQPGFVVSDNLNGLNTKNRMFMLVDTSGTPWGAITGGSGTNTIQHASDGTSANHWVGFNVYNRFGSNGFYRSCPITASTSTSITYSTCSALTTESMYQVQGIGSGTEPNWDSASSGTQVQYNATNQGVGTTSGSSCIGFSSSFNGNTNDWVVIPGADQVAPAGQTTINFPLYGKITSAIASGNCPNAAGGFSSHATLTRAASVTLNNVPAYTGTPITDGNLSWININPITIWASKVVNSSINFGLIEAGGVGLDQVLVPSGTLLPLDTIFTSGNNNINGNPVLSYDITAHFGSTCGAITATPTIDLTKAFSKCNSGILIPTSNTTLNAPAPQSIGAQEFTLVIITSGTTSYQLTFGSNFTSSGVLNTGSVNGAVYVIKFVGLNQNGATTWMEVSRSSSNAAGTNSTVSSPAGPNSTVAFKMQGLAGTITPKKTGNVNLQVCGTIIDSGLTAPGNGIQYQLSYGTGAAPTSNAALAGTQTGTIQEFMLAQTATSATNVFVPYCQTTVINGLTIGTAYWIDLASEAVANTGFAFQNVNISAHEF